MEFIVDESAGMAVVEYLTGTGTPIRARAEDPGRESGGESAPAEGRSFFGLAFEVQVPRA